LIDNILVMNKSFEKLEINHSIKDKSFKIHNFKQTVNDLRKNADIKIRMKINSNLFQTV